jgi:hypothetical protein
MTDLLAAVAVVVRADFLLACASPVSWWQSLLAESRALSNLIREKDEQFVMGAVRVR